MKWIRKYAAVPAAMQPRNIQPIQLAEPSFLYQLDAPFNEGGINIWGGNLQANNCYDSTAATKAAKLFVAAEDMLAALKGLCEVGVPGAPRWDAAHTAIAKAEQG